METTLSIASIIIIVFGLLQIILFFKMWGMTNNVSNISSKLHESKDEGKEYELLMISGKYDTVYQILIDKLSKDMSDAYHSFNESYYEKEAKKLIEIYNPKFQKTGKEIPEHILKCSDYVYVKTLLD